MGLPFFVYNVALIIFNTIICIGFLYAFMQSKKRTYLWVSVLFAIYIVDVVILYMADYVPSFSLKFLAAFGSEPYLYLLVLISMPLCMRMIIGALFAKPIQVKEGLFYGIALSAIPLLVAFGSTELSVFARDYLLEIVNVVIIFEAFIWLHQQKEALETWTQRFLMVLFVFYAICTAVDLMPLVFGSLLAIPEYRRIAYEVINIGFIVAGLVVLYRELYRSPELHTAEILDEVTQRYSLTHREREVLGLLLKGYSNKEISEAEFISVGTVKTHTHNLYVKLGVSNRREATRLIAKY